MKKVLSLNLMLLIIMFVFMSVVAVADEIHLKDGSVINAIVYHEKNGTVSCYDGDSKWTVFTINRESVEKIVYIEEEAPVAVMTTMTKAEVPTVAKKDITWHRIECTINYEIQTPGMKEKVRLKVLKDFGKNPDRYVVRDGTVHLR